MSIKTNVATTTLIATYDDDSYLERISSNRYRLMYHEGNGKYRVGEIIPASCGVEAMAKARAIRMGLVMNCL